MLCDVQCAPGHTAEYIFTLHMCRTIKNPALLDLLKLCQGGGFPLSQTRLFGSQLELGGN